MDANMKITVIWNMALMIEIASAPEKFFNFYRTKCCSSLMVGIWTGWTAGQLAKTGLHMRNVQRSHNELGYLSMHAKCHCYENVMHLTQKEPLHFKWQPHRHGTAAITLDWWISCILYEAKMNSTQNAQTRGQRDIIQSCSKTKYESHCPSYW
jgi:hypothetical protein